MSASEGPDALHEAERLEPDRQHAQDPLLSEVVERALRESETRLRTAFAYQRAVWESSLDGIIAMDGSGVILDASPATERIFGWTRDQLVGRTIADTIVPERLRDQHRRGLERYLASSQPRILGKRVELPALRADGTELPLELTVVRVDNDGQPVFIGTVRDISERVSARRAVADFDRMFSLHLDVFCIADVEGRLVRLNPAWERTLGFPVDEMVGRSFLELVHRDDVSRSRRQARRLLAGSQIVAFENRCRHADGSYRWLSWSAVPVLEDGLFYAVGRDVTERRATEDQLRRMQRLESIGLLAAGIAHDYNNVLSIQKGYVALLAEALREREDLAEPLAEIDTAANRAADLTRQLLLFSRKQVMRTRAIDLNHVIQEMARMLGRILGEDIALHVEPACELPAVRADAGMIEQVIANLVVNARDAMPGGGTLTVSTAVSEIDEREAVRMPGARAGRFVTLSVTDSGTGIHARDLDRIFEPFFTTKEVGKGTGLGLATVYGIARQHEGWVDVSSRLGRGTTFRVYLPVSNGRTEEAATDVASIPVVGGDETILVVEDERAVRAMVTRVLGKHGYRVIDAASGPDALGLWARHAAEIDLVLTDMVMPGGMTGMDLATRLRADRPSLPVVFTSGYSAELAGLDRLGERSVYLPKPYAPQDLVRLIRSCLDVA